MSKYIDIKVKYENVVKDLADLRRHVRKNAQFGLDKVLDRSVDELKGELFSIISSDIRTSSSVPNAPTDIPDRLNISKSKSDIIKEIFEADIAKSDIFKTGNTVDDASNVFVVRDGRIKAWQSISDSSTYGEQENTFKNRLKRGIVIDSSTGRIYKVDPNTVTGMKLECSRDTGQTVDSAKKFDAYKNSPHIKRRKNNSPYDRTAVWTVRQEDVRYMMDRAIDMQSIIDLIQQDELEIAKNVLEQYNTDGSFTDFIDNITHIQEGDARTEGFKNYENIRDMVRNLKVRKEMSSTGTEGTTKYVLVTSYDRTDNEREVEFFKELKIQTWLWVAKNEKKWLTAMMHAITKALKRYDPKAKFS